MSSLSIEYLRSAEELKSCFMQWNDLWQESDQTFAVFKAETLYEWLIKFNEDNEFIAVVIKNNSDFVAALPLVRGPNKLGMRFYRTPWSVWLVGGDLLIRREWINLEVFQSLVLGLKNLKIPLVQICETRYQEAYASSLVANAKSLNAEISVHPMYGTELLKIDQSWEEYIKSWTPGHRRNMKKFAQDLKKLGDLRFEVKFPPSAEELEELLQIGFELENSGWKGRAQSSILSHKEATEFYLKQAKIFQASGELFIAFLFLNDQAIAFKYGWISKKTLHTLKVAYNEDFKKFSPGQVLMAHILESMFKTKAIDALDFCGKSTLATSRWTRDQYLVGNITIGLSFWAKIALRIFKYRNRFFKKKYTAKNEDS